MTARNFYKKIQHHTTMKKEIKFFGQVVTLDIFMSRDDEPRPDQLGEWRISDYYKRLDRETRIQFDINGQYPERDTTRFTVNNVTYRHVAGVIHINQDGTTVFFIKANPELTKSAKMKFEAEFAANYTPTGQDLDDCRAEAWDKFIDRLDKKAKEMETEAAQLRQAAIKYRNPESATETKWRTPEPESAYKQSAYHARQASIEQGHDTYVEEVYQIKGNKLINTIIHPTTI